MRRSWAPDCLPLPELRSIRMRKNVPKRYFLFWKIAPTQLLHTSEYTGVDPRAPQRIIVASFPAFVLGSTSWPLAVAVACACPVTNLDSPSNEQGSIHALSKTNWR